MATLVCRRFPRGVCRAATFSRTANCSKKKIPNEDQKVGVCSSSEEGTMNKANDPNTVLSFLEYNILYNPSAYSRNRKVAPRKVYADWEDCEEDSVGSVHSNLGAKLAQNKYTITCSRRLSSSRNTLLDLAFSKTSERQAHSVQPAEQRKRGDEQEVDDVEVFDTKEDPRAFQKLRTDYSSFCYSNTESLEPLSAQEGSHTLHKVTVLKSNLTPEVIADCFNKLGSLSTEQHVVVKSDTRFAMLCRYSVENLRFFSSSQLLGILKAFVHLRVSPSHSLLNVYEVEFCRRVWDMNLNQLLLIADLWRCLGRSVPQFLEILCSFISLHWKDLTLPQLVQLIYIIGEARKAPPDLLQKLESLVLRYLDQMNLEEVGTACLGFFKSHSGFSEYLMRKIGEKVAVKMEDISSYALVSVLKMYRFTYVDHVPFLNRLGQVVPQRIPSIGTQGVMHIALACASLHYLDEQILNAIAAEVPSRAPHCRSKDAAKFLWSFASLNYEPPNSGKFYEALTAQLHRKLHEFERFPEHLLTGLLALAFAGQFPYDLIDFALSPRFVRLATETTQFELKKDLFTLDGTVEIECPTYKGKRIEPQLRQEITEMMCDWASKDLYSKSEIAEATTCLQAMLGGPQYVKNHMILPHSRSSDLEVHLDLNGRPVPCNIEVPATVLPKRDLKDCGILVTDELIVQLLKGKTAGNSHQNTIKKSNSEYLFSCSNATEAAIKDHSQSGSYHVEFSGGIPVSDDLLQNLLKSKSSAEKPLARPKQSNVQKLAVQVTNRNHYCYASHKLLGLHSMKRRQLHQLGFLVVEVPFWEWFPLLKRTRSEKLAYLHQKIFNSLD